MLEFNYGSDSEPASVLQRSSDLLAVRTHSRDPITHSFGIEDGEKVMSTFDAGVEIYRVPAHVGTLAARKALLLTHEDVSFAGTVLVDPNTGEPVLYSENIFIKFIDALTVEQCLRMLAEAELKVRKALSYSTNAYFVSAAKGSGSKVFQIAKELLQRQEVDFCHPELLRQRLVKAFHPNQWHLRKTTIDGVEIDASANVEAAHRMTEGEGIVIAVIDDGFDIDHVEFSGADKIVAPCNFDRSGGIKNPRPRAKYQSHGTSVAGVACANGMQGASGVAPKARLLPIKTNAELGALSEGGAFVWAADNGADIINCSWGPPDGDWSKPDDPRHLRCDKLPASTKVGIEYALTKGRGGKGCVIFFAAGNGNESVDNDGYASHPDVIAVAACNDRNRRSFYSDYGQAVWCAFPSSDVVLPPESAVPGREQPKTKGIWTVDRRGKAGYDLDTECAGTVGDYTTTFGGTSSAAPGAAGVAALMLAVNPDLYAKEVKMLLAQSCQKIGSTLDGAGGQYDANRRCDYYGHGRIDAERAVQLAAAFVRANSV